MRKFTLILVAAMTALSLSAAAGTHTTRIRGQVENPALKARLQKMPAVINGHKLDSRLLEHPEKAQSMLRKVRRAEEAAPKPVTNVPVEETPAGTSTSWSRDSYAYLSYLGMVFAIEDYGFACMGQQSLQHHRTGQLGERLSRRSGQCHFRRRIMCLYRRI